MQSYATCGPLAMSYAAPLPYCTWWPLRRTGKIYYVQLHTGQTLDNPEPTAHTLPQSNIIQRSESFHTDYSMAPKKQPHPHSNTSKLSTRALTASVARKGRGRETLSNFPRTTQVISAPRPPFHQVGRLINYRLCARLSLAKHMRVGGN